MAVNIYFPALSSNTFTEGPAGYYSFPITLVENPIGSGLYDIPGYLLPEGGDLYSVPLDMLGQADVGTSNIKSFSVQEDATPIDPSSSFGGVGQINIGMDDFPDAPRLIGEVILTDGSRGKTSGTIRSISGTDGALSLTADSALGAFNTDRTALPFNGTLRDAVQYYCDLVGVQNDVVVDTTIASRAVVYPGWVGNAWVYVKQMLAKEQVEMALVFDRVYVRPLRQLIANQNKLVSSGYTLDNSNAAQRVEVYYYNNTWGSSQEVYPLKGEDPSIYSVNAGETVTVSHRVNATLATVNQPVVQSFVANTTYAGTNGVYSVTGADNLPITAAQWTALGGRLTVAISPDDPTQLDITIVGAKDPTKKLSPFRIAMSSGSGGDYNSLHITGTGVTWDKKMITLRTGVTNMTSSTDVGVTVDNPFISTLGQAYSLGAKTAQAYAGINYTRTGSAYDLNRAGQGTALVQATIGDFNDATTPGTTIASFNTLWSGQDIYDFNVYWNDQITSLWENQLFGNAPGARLIEDDANFRITSATTTEGTVQYTAALDTTVKDFNDEWPEGGTSALVTNRATNPSFETASGTVIVATNSVVNPNFETNSTGYVVGGAAASLLRQQDTTNPPLPGRTWHARIQTNATTAASISSSVTYAVVAAEKYHAEFKLRGTPGEVIVLRITWTGATATTTSNQTIASATAWQTVVFDGVVPAGATAARIDLLRSSGGTGSVIDMSCAQYLRNVGARLPVGYFDGGIEEFSDTDVTTAWTGTANASSSTVSAPGVATVATSFPDRARPYQSTQWADTGTKSLRITPFTNLSYGEVALTGLTIGATYQVSYKRRTTAVLTGSPDSNYNGKFGVVSPNAASGPTMIETAPNTIGVWPVSGLFVAASTTHSLRLGHGFTGGDVWVDSLMVVELPPDPAPTLLRTNLLANPRAGVASASPGNWLRANGTGGASTFARVTGAVDGPLPGISTYYRATITTVKTGGSSGNYARNGTTTPMLVSGVAGDQVTVSLYVRPSVTGDIYANATLRLAGATVVGQNGTATSCPANVWTRLSATVTATGAYDDVQVYAIEATTNLLPVGATVDGTAYMAEVSSTLGDYFDGDTTDLLNRNYVWTGTANASLSTESSIVPQTYTGPYFDGSFTDIHYQGVTTDYAWTGTANASNSTRTITTRDFRIADFNAQFAGMTMKDYAVIPLRKDY